MGNANRVVIVTGTSRVSERVLSRATADSDSAWLSGRARLHLRRVVGDNRDRPTAQKVVAAAKERFMRVDTLVSNCPWDAWARRRTSSIRMGEWRYRFSQLHITR